MAITPNSDGTITITNGDANIVREIQHDFGIRTTQDALAFILQVSKNAQGKPLGFRQDNGAWIGFQPSLNVREAPPTDASGSTPA